MDPLRITSYNVCYTKLLRELGNITEKTSVTGKVKPIDSVDLTFEQSGKISDVSVKVGDHVRADQILVRMTSQELTRNNFV